MSHQNVQNATTADSKCSIWHYLPQDEFRRHLVDLEECTNAVPIDSQIFSISPDGYANQDPYSLSLKDEQQLADGFASIAALQEGAQSVSAVSIEEDVNVQGLTIRFAAIDTIDDHMRFVLQEVVAILSSTAATHLTTRDPVAVVETLFDLIVRIHHIRILGRLRSIKWEKPKYLSRTHKKPLWEDFDNLLHRVQFLYKKSEVGLRQDTEAQIQHLASTYKNFECTSPSLEDDIISLKHLINSTYTFCISPAIRIYATRLSKLLNPTKQIAAATKCLHQLEKVAAYRRIPITLFRIAQAHPSLFSNISLAFLTPYSSTPTTIAYESWAKTCHVHAEVQLAVYYDLQKQDRLPDYNNNNTATRLYPRAIGTSKHLCYLCFLFLTHHPHGYHVANTHGRLYDQWTIPDLSSYTSSTVAQYRAIIQKMDDEVLRMTREVKDEVEREIAEGKRRGDRQMKGKWRAEPMTSRENLLLCTEGET